MISQEALNQRARQLAAGGETPYNAVRLAAQEAGLQVVEDDGEQCIIYRTAAGDLINCWAYASYGVADAVEDGGLGFDNQIEWYTQRKAESRPALYRIKAGGEDFRHTYDQVADLWEATETPGEYRVHVVDAAGFEQLADDDPAIVSYRVV